MTASISKPRIGAAHRICLESDPMNYLRKFFALTALLALFGGAQAQTYCASTVVRMYAQAGSTGTLNTSILLASGTSFQIFSTDTNYKSIQSMAAAAMISGQSVEVLYAAGGVNCASTSWRTDAIQFSVYP